MKKIILAAIILASSVSFFSCKKDNPDQHTVKYLVVGNKLNVFYTDANGQTQTVTNADASWTYQFVSSHHGQSVTLKVVSVTAGGQVGGKIFIDGQQAIENNNADSIAISATIP